MDDRGKREALAAARVEIARRIGRVCASLPAEEFEKLLDRMALVQWKYEVFPIAGESITLDILTTAEREILKQRES